MKKNKPKDIRRCIHCNGLRATVLYDAKRKLYIHKGCLLNWPQNGEKSA